MTVMKFVLRLILRDLIGFVVANIGSWIGAVGEGMQKFYTDEPKKETESTDTAEKK